MKAKCPHCNGGCPQCIDGYIEVGVKQGVWYTRHCTACGFDNGVRIENATSGSPACSAGLCVMCNSGLVEWLRLEADDGEADD